MLSLAQRFYRRFENVVNVREWIDSNIFYCTSIQTVYEYWNSLFRYFLFYIPMNIYPNKLWLIHPKLFVFVLLFAWRFLSHSRIFHSVGDITIAGGGLQKIWPMLGTYGYWVRVRVLQLASHTVTRVSVYNDYLRQKNYFIFRAIAVSKSTIPAAAYVEKKCKAQTCCNCPIHWKRTITAIQSRKTRSEQKTLT